MYRLEYFIREIDKTAWAFDYKFYQNDHVLDEGTYTYRPWKTPENLNAVRNTGRWAVRTQLAKRYGVKEMTTVCLNPQSDFVSRSELRANTRRKKFMETYNLEETAEKELEETVLMAEPQKIEKHTPTDRLYEVVEVGGIWTIKKHDTKWFTAEEAKTQLFAKVVNGD